MPHSRIVVIGASAGGFEAVRAVLETLPDHFPASVLVVIHTGPDGVFPDALARNTPLPVPVSAIGPQLVKVADARAAGANGRPGRPRGRRPANDSLAVTREQARLSKQMHQAARARTRGATDGKPRNIRRSR